LSEKLFQSVASYIDEYYVDSHDFTYGTLDENRRRIRRRREAEICESRALMPEAPVMDAMEELTSCGAAPKAKAATLAEMLNQADAGFTQRLLELIDQSGKKDSQIYKKANLTKQHFSKIRNNPNYKPTKPTAISLALALELDLDATKDLIGRAGYALTNSSKFDLIIRYAIEHGKYNLVEINCMLFEHDQSLLGS
jgi:DNA-binding phage protein